MACAVVVPPARVLEMDVCHFRLDSRFRGNDGKAEKTASGNDGKAEKTGERE
jgi:hypothetical protein